MKAVVCTSYGLPDTLVVEERPALEAPPGKVVVSVRAASVKFSDTLLIQNKYQNKIDVPFVPGGEVTGVIKAVGAGVERWKVGDRVSAQTGQGGFAEEALADPDKLSSIPDSIDFADAAGLSNAYGTSYYALIDRGQLKAGETVLILGASGGVGLAAVEIAKIVGAKVIACASTEEKLAVCREHGADYTINYDKEDLRARVKEITGGKGLDVVYDPVGGDYTELALRDMAWGGRFLVIGFAAGPIPKIALNLPLIKGCSIVGVWVGQFSKKEPAKHRANVDQVWKWVAEGKIKPHISGKFPIEKAADALNDIMARKVAGKVVLVNER